MATSAARMAARRPLAAASSREGTLWLRGSGHPPPPDPEAASGSAAPVAALLLAATAAAAATADDGAGIGNEDPRPTPPPPWRPANLAPAPCRCDAFHAGPANVPMAGSGILRLQRRRTIRRIEDESTRQSLESRYAVDPTPLGEGSYGEVYLATDRATGEKLALKKISKERTDDDGFQREMTALLHIRARGGHPHVCALRENFVEGDHYILILDLIRGGELFDHLIEHGAYSEADAARLMQEVASALDFLHGIGIVHADLKPENLMLSSRKETDAAIKIVDFGCAEVLPEFAGDNPAEESVDGDDSPIWSHLAKYISKKRVIQPGCEGGTTPAYCPPESFDRGGSPIQTTMDMWAVGIILYIMLCGAHPFDLYGTATDEEIEENIHSIRRPPLEGEFTEHLSASAIDLLSKLMAEDPTKRLSAHEMLQHPWVRGDTASTDIMAGSAKRLSRFRQFKTKIQTEAFKHLVSWSNDDKRRNMSEKGKSLMERAFSSMDLRDISDDEGSQGCSADQEEASCSSMTLSDFSELLGENMKQKFFPRGHVVYREGDAGDKMYFINSGTVAVSTNAGFKAKLGQGDSFGEGGLLNSHKSRSATLKCTTPVHAIEIDEECFRKFLASSDSALALRLKEKVNAHKFGRAEYLIGKHEKLIEMHAKRGENIFKEGDDADALYIVEEGNIDVRAKGHTVYSVKPGDVFGAQSLVMNRPRRTSAVCVSDRCKLKRMEAKDFKVLLESSPNLKDSLREICLRREFRRAVVLKLKKPFPSKEELKHAFDAIDLDGSGELDVEEVKELLKFLDNTMSDDEVRVLVNSLDLNGSGTVNFEEFQSIFGRG